MALPLGETVRFLPYMSWNRLESRPRRSDFSRVLKAKIHDPLWMIARQLQMGEFKGNDTGSGILAKAVMEYSRIYAYSAKDATGSLKPYATGQMPLEPLVESVQYRFSIKERVRLGQIWKREIGKQFSSSGAAAIFSALAAAPDFFIDTQEPDGSTSAARKIAKSQYFGQSGAASFIRAASWKGETLDGAYLTGKCSAPGTPLAAFDVDLNGALASLLGSQSSLFNTACSNFAAWVTKMYSRDLQPGSAEYWNGKKLEYEIELYADDQKRLSSSNAHNGSLDWYSFEEADATGVAFPAANTPPAPPVVKEMLMTTNRFAGMPSSRWWEFENGRVNFGRLEGDTSDMAKIMLAQFALVYQDDWFVIPYRIPVGSYSKIHGMVVTDVFGIKTYVANHTEEYQESSGDFAYGNDTWKDWSWMDVSRKDSVVNFKKPTGRMLLLPTLASRMESEPVESVTFVRDELSNLVWAIEKTVPDFLGRGTDAQQVATDYRSYLERLAPSLAPPPAAAGDAPLDYTLMNTVPENWIPFIAKHLPGGNNIRDIRLQRASMPRILGSLPTSLVRPRTEILSAGLGDGTTPVIGYDINEEEVSRAGTRIETTFQRTRWYGGKTILWVGRKRSTGRGQGSSGLVFDAVRDKEE